MASEQERDKSTPRIKSGNCSAVLSTANSNNSSTGSAAAASSTSDIYDKQMAWKLHGQRKIQNKTHELTSIETQECTFAPKTNRSKRRALPDSPSPTFTKGDHVAAAELASPLRFRSSESVFSFADDSSCGASSSLTMRPSASITATAGTSSGTATPIHPTESQESSIQLHLVRQERAREHAQEAQQKLFSSSGAQHKTKDFTKVTAFAPFKLSVGNQVVRPIVALACVQKPRASSASPTKTRQHSSSIPPASAITSSNNSTSDSSVHTSPPTNEQQQRAATSRESGERSKIFKKASRAQSTTSAAASNHQQQQHLTSGNGSMNQQQESREESWDKERSSLLLLLDTQRRELEQRERAQQDALQIAENFANAIQSFEERLVVVESSTAQELASIRELLQRQAAATDLILQSLGIAQLPPTTSSSPTAAPPDSPPLRSPTSSASISRRETK